MGFWICISYASRRRCIIPLKEDNMSKLQVLDDDGTVLNTIEGPYLLAYAQDGQVKVSASGNISLPSLEILRGLAIGILGPFLTMTGNKSQ